MPKMKPEEFFYNKQQLSRYKYAVALATKLKKFQDEGYLIFDTNNEVVTGPVEIRTDFDYNIWDIVKYGPYSLVDISYWCDGGKLDGKPYVESKKQIKDAFANFRIVHPKYIKKVV